MLDSIFTIFKVLFLSEVLLLTPNPIDIEKEYVLNIAPPLVAITKGANIQIDISGMVSSKNSVMPNDIYALIPPGSVTAYMYPEKGDSIPLVFNRGLSFSGNNKVSIILSNVDEMKTNLVYKKIKFVTQKPLSKVKVMWFNSKK